MNNKLRSNSIKASTTIPKDDQKAFISDLTKLELLNADFNIQ